MKNETEMKRGQENVVSGKFQINLIVTKISYVNYLIHNTNKKKKQNIC